MGLSWLIGSFAVFSLKKWGRLCFITLSVCGLTIGDIHTVNLICAAINVPLISKGGHSSSARIVSKQSYLRSRCYSIVSDFLFVCDLYIDPKKDNRTIQVISPSVHKVLVSTNGTTICFQIPILTFLTT